METTTYQVNEVKVSFQPKYMAKDAKKICRSEDAVDYLRNIFSPDWIEHHEEFMIILLNQACKAIGYSKISQGNTDCTPVSTKIIAQVAVKGNASSVIVAHNHPSGNREPSRQDIDITKKIRQALEIFDIRLLEHIIMTSDDYYSFADNGLI
jgi:DNA repair protein RadC